MYSKRNMSIWVGNNNLLWNAKDSRIILKSNHQVLVLSLHVPQYSKVVLSLVLWPSFQTTGCNTLKTRPKCQWLMHFWILEAQYLLGNGSLNQFYIRRTNGRVFAHSDIAWQSITRIVKFNITKSNIVDITMTVYRSTPSVNWIIKFQLIEVIISFQSVAFISPVTNLP